MLRVYHDAFVRTAPLIEAQLIAGKTVSEIVNSDVFKKYKNWERKKDWIKVIKTRLDGKTIPSICEVMTKIFVQKGLIAAIKEYHYLRKHYPDKYNFDERQLNNLGYALLDRKMIKEAISVFELNKQIYPKISNAYDNLAEAYMINGEKGKAIWSYKKSLKLNPSNQITRDRLKELYKKK